VGLLLTGALFVMADRLGGSEPGPLWFLSLLVLYPVGAVAGYDLASGGGGLAYEGPLVRAGALALALAGAHVWIAATYIVGVLFDSPGRSTFWAVAYVTCVAGGALGRWAAVRMAATFTVTPGMLVAIGVVVVLLAWMIDFAAFSIVLSRTDSLD
jgi:hypothetical protein